MKAYTVERVRFRELAYDPAALAHLDTTRSPWYESEAERAAVMRRAPLTAARLRWVRGAMKRHLSARERQLMQLRYFEGLPCQVVARRAGVTRQTVARALRRAVAKLRVAARAEGALDIG